MGASGIGTTPTGQLTPHAEGLRSEFAGREHERGRAAGADPVLPCVEPEIATGYVGKLPEGKDDVWDRGTQIDVLKRIDGEMDGSKTINLGLSGR